MPRTPTLTNTPEFRAMWDGPMTTKEIAQVFGVTRPAVSLAAKRFGYPDRMARVGSHRPSQEVRL